MLVADPLDVVFAKTVVEHGGTLQCFHCNDLAPEGVLEVVASSDGAG